MSRATVELDFFGLEKENSKPRFDRFNRQRSFRDLQSAIAKINPEVLKSVIVSSSANQNPENGNDSKKSLSVPATPKEEQCLFPPLPVFSTVSRPNLENPPKTGPLTIFYNGSIAVFDVPQDKAETILKLAEKGISKTVDCIDPNVANVAAADQKQMWETLNGALRIARRKSLETFLQKRKERLASVSPYSCTLETRV